MDGVVAAYRFPYLLASDSLVFKQDSGFYEHFYSKLTPYKHYVPFKRDLSDLIERLQWAKENDDRAREIVSEARKFVDANLLPQHIYCYHMALFKVSALHFFFIIYFIKLILFLCFLPTYHILLSICF